MNRFSKSLLRVKLHVLLQEIKNIFPAKRCQGAKVISPNEFLIFFKKPASRKETHNKALNPDTQKTARRLAFRSTERNEEENIDQLE